MKKITLTLAIIVCIVLALGLIYGDGFYTKTKGLSKEEAKVEELVLKAIEIQYRGGRKKELEKIFTSDYIKQMDYNSRKFYHKFSIYIIEKNFMKNFYVLNENEAMVSVVVEAMDIRARAILEITLIKGTDGDYLISNILLDL